MYQGMILPLRSVGYLCFIELNLLKEHFSPHIQ